MWASTPDGCGAPTSAPWIGGTRGTVAVTICTAVPGGSNTGSGGSVAGSLGRPRPGGG